MSEDGGDGWRERIAGIEGRTAVIVALVGALSSIGTVAVTRYFDTTPAAVAAPKQHWLRIGGVEGPEGARIRIVAHVDDVTFAYPTLAAWAEVGPNMTEALFPLPVGGTEHRVRFTVEALDGAPATDYMSQKIDTRQVSADQQLYVVNAVQRSGGGSAKEGVGSTRSGASGTSRMTIRYAITGN